MTRLSTLTDVRPTVHTVLALDGGAAAGDAAALELPTNRQPVTSRAETMRFMETKTPWEPAWKEEQSVACVPSATAAQNMRRLAQTGRHDEAAVSVQTPQRLSALER